jgi:SAM-dependent methyltransferase
VLSNFERYQRIAWAYDLLDLPFEYGRYRKIRPLLFRGLSGRILEAGVGTGRNFPFYPPGSEVVGIDLSPAMLARAERRRPVAATEVELLQMDVTRLSFPDRSFDAAVAMFLFCTLPDDLQVASMQELGRVVKPGACSRGRTATARIPLCGRRTHKAARGEGLVPTDTHCANVHTSSATSRRCGSSRRPRGANGLSPRAVVAIVKNNVRAPGLQPSAPIAFALASSHRL